MSNYDLIAFDMDGTLLNSEKAVSKDSLDAMKKATANGKLVALSTGRCMLELQDYLSLLPDVQYVISASGAMIYSVKEQKDIETHAIAPEIVLELLERIEKEDLMVHILAQESMVQKNQVSRMADYQMGIYQGMFETITVKLDDIFAYYRENPVPILKLNLYNRSVEQREKIRSLLADLPLVIVDSEIASLECSAQNVSKGQGLKELCSYLQLPVSRTIAVGDADNDLEILKTAGLAVAMGNANAHVLACADVVVRDNDHGGCAEAIEKYLLEI